MRVHVLVTSAILAAAAVACAVPNLPDDTLDGDQNGTEPAAKASPTKKDAGSTPSSDGTGTGTSPTPTPAPTPTPSPTPTPTPAPTNACAATSTKAACYDCCETANPTALDFLDDEWGKCACVSPGACANVCAAEYCGGLPTQVGGACDACLASRDQACSTQAETACSADATCAKLPTCDTTSACASKP